MRRDPDVKLVKTALDKGEASFNTHAQKFSPPSQVRTGSEIFHRQGPTRHSPFIVKSLRMKTGFAAVEVKFNTTML